MVSLFLLNVIVVVFLQVEFGISKSTFFSSYSGNRVFLRLFETKLFTCKRECAIRQKCDSINHCQKQSICELNYANVALEDPQRRPGWIYITKENWEKWTKVNHCQCSLNERCHTRVNSASFCEITECGPPANNTDGYKVYGNVQHVHAKAILSCNDNVLTPNNPHATLTCDSTGTWTRLNALPICGREIFRAFQGLGRGIFQAWAEGKTTTTDVNCLQTPRPAHCTAHYRNSDIDQWDTLNVSRVRFSVCKGDEQVHYVLFNGRGSDARNWFSSERILGSSWIDLPLKYPIDVTMKESSISLLYSGLLCFTRRRFVISQPSSQCEQDTGWFFATNRVDMPCCNYEKDDHLALLYSKGNTVGSWSRPSQIARADYVSVVIFTDS